MRGEVRPGRRGAWGGGGASGVHGEGPTQGLGAMARAELTANMPRMVVTLEVSQLSGWLNADAPCRVERRACDVGRGVDREAGGRVGRRRRSGYARGRPDSRPLGARARAERTPNMPTMLVALEVSRLSG